MFSAWLWALVVITLSLIYLSQRKKPSNILKVEVDMGLLGAAKNAPVADSLWELGVSENCVSIVEDGILRFIEINSTSKESIINSIARVISF